MKRRDVLTTTAAIVFAGCLGGNDGDNGNTGNGTGTTDESTATSTETPTGDTAAPTATDAGTGTSKTVRETETTTRTATEPADTATESTDTATGTATGTTNPTTPVSGRFTVINKDAPPATEARVAVENGGSRVVVTGTITGRNGCQTAVLDSVRKTNSGLVITVATERDAPANAVCSMALVGIEYRFSMRVESPPKSVTVIHRGAGGKKTVTTAKPGN